MARVTKYEPIEPSLFTQKFVSVQPGEPYRLLPFGHIGKPGLDKHITPDFAKLFKLPHFKPPIKLGSHNDETPAGGHIIGLEVRDDGLYAIPEMNESGTVSLDRGDYRYHSPEIIWEDEGIFDAGGEFIQGPLILGDAFLHTPHLGEAAALYGAQVYRVDRSDQPNNQSLDHEEVPLSEDKKMEMSLVEKLLGGKLEEKVTNLEAEVGSLTEQVTELETVKSNLEAEVKSLTDERDEAVGKLESIEAEKVQAVKEAAVREALGEVELDDETVTLLSNMDEAHREKLLVKFKALHEQAKLGDVENEIGSEGGGIEDPTQAFHLAVTRKIKETGKGYLEALELVSDEKPDLFKAYNDSKGGN